MTLPLSDSLKRMLLGDPEFALSSFHALSQRLSFEEESLGIPHKLNRGHAITIRTTSSPAMQSKGTGPSQDPIPTELQ